MKQAELYISEGLHPRVVTEGFEEGKKKALEILEEMKIKITDEEQRDVLTKIASTSLKTKIHPKVFSFFIYFLSGVFVERRRHNFPLPLQLADQLTGICVDAMLAIDQTTRDLHMVEIMEMQHRTESDTSLVKGLVLDHGGRHPDMPKAVKNAYILTCNVRSQGNVFLSPIYFD